MGGMIYVIGMGPGDKEHMTYQASRAIEDSDVIVGYNLYVDMMKEMYPDKEYIQTGMKQETDRCIRCIELARAGSRVSLICSGDAGVYGMASPLLELLSRDDDTEVTVIPGITAANSGAALLGAPLGHDYCVISLSDLLTSWEVIELRLKAAVEADFVIAIYNPASHSRPDHLRRAVDIMLKAGASKNRACGYVRNIGREGEKAKVCTLGDLKEIPADMFTTVYVGNSESFIRDGRLITGRGYR